MMVFAQNSGLKTKNILPESDTLKLDSMSILPNSFSLKNKNGEAIDTSFYKIDFAAATLIFKKKLNDTLVFNYRTFNFNFSKKYKNKEISLLQPNSYGDVNPFSYNFEKQNPGGEILSFGSLTKNGSISRGVTFGNAQDLAVNSNLNLQLSGQISDNVFLTAAITDENIPIQPDGNTQQLQDFDQVYVQLYDKKSKLTVGDFILSRPESYFTNYYKRGQGGSLSTLQDFKNKKNDSLKLGFTVSAAVSKGKFSRNVVQGIEGNQGPYLLRGAEGEQFIIVLSGTEVVYIDGELLQRGQENDYVIDYNTAQITFTAKKLITKDRRIVVEFQYSDRNYARSLIQTGTSFENKKMKINLNFFSEQDNKNQSLLQELTQEQKDLMSDIGDSLNQAQVSSYNLIEFNANQVQYVLKDTVANGSYYDSVFVVSNQPDSTNFKVTFSQVGFGNGDYILSSSTANGRVFEWVAPIDGLKQGNYAPVILLVTPKRRQMLAGNIQYKLTKNTEVYLELALSNNDLNTFSGKDAADDKDIAVKFKIENSKKLNLENENSWLLKSGILYEQVNKNFTQIERFRAVEFERDWNIINKRFNENQYIPGLNFNLSKKDIGFLEYNFTSFLTERQYQGLKHQLNANINTRKWEWIQNGSFLTANDVLENTQFLRQRATVKRKFRTINIGIWEDFENNIRKKTNNDTLLSNSYSYLEWEGFLESKDTSRTSFKFFYRQRIDNAADTLLLARSTFAENYGLSLGFTKNPNSILRFTGTYRKLQIVNTELSNNQPENTLLTRIEYNLRLLKGTFMFTTFYEVGSGLENRKSFTFIEVPAGQGSHAYLGDLNGNGIQDVNEFEVAAFVDQAKFLKVFVPTDEFVRTFSNQFNQIINISPANVWSVEKTKWKKFLGRFYNQTAYRIDRKTNYESPETAFNPFFSEIVDTSLISLNSSLRNTIFFNRIDPIWGMEYSWQDNRNKSLLTNGFEARQNTYQTARLRINASKLILLNFEGNTGIKVRESELFANQAFYINYFNVEPRITFQFSTKLRWALFYRHSEKSNKPEFGAEYNKAENFGTEIRYSIVSKGNLLLNVNYINNSYNGQNNTSLSFEMLEGLSTGENITWSVAFQQNLSNNLQLNLTYNGRKSIGIPTIHNGGVQVRAFF